MYRELPSKRKLTQRTMHFSRRLPLGVALCLVITTTGCNEDKVHRPQRKSEQYRSVIADYVTATPLPSEEVGNNRQWKHALSANPRLTVLISGRRFMDI